ncbi:hydrogenase nickel incorporation protein HypA/HybF [Rhodopseudomonas rhenobacensis]|uniref:Hydrogenase maturation factor HypA n=1 Tax=Rhodopseudomonas rhenobacensis TaxID=87461 RepID=A0A7W7Z1C9_9BRAD|nr:hydrogenase maturation nickel metallochaperone HypA [Rhodopseudomonas rhenobacensis]MBB5046223.1 hydrogenase nickel incorporation protein HypA/HybF [Rhodopseudomonas rhenobacensis]
MHEMTICEEIISQLEDERRRRGFDMVKRLRLEIGLLSCLDPEALRYAFEITSRDTFLDGMVLEIDRPPGQAKCLDCGAEATVSSRLDHCPSCGSSRLDASGGAQMRLVEMEIAGQAA